MTTKAPPKRTHVAMSAKHVSKLDAAHFWLGCGEAPYAASRAGRVRAIVAHYASAPWACPPVVPPPRGSAGDWPTVELRLDERSVRTLGKLQAKWKLPLVLTLNRLLAGWLACSR